MNKTRQRLMVKWNGTIKLAAPEGDSWIKEETYKVRKLALKNGM